MVLSAHDVAEELRRRIPGLPKVKLHKLLYYCQGHHLATFAEPLFGEEIGAWDMGPVVEKLWRDETYALEPPPRQDLDEAALNTIGYVLSRYGRLNGYELEIMTHGESPWRLASATRQPGGRALIRADWIAEHFRTDGAPDDGFDDIPLDSGLVSAWLRESAERDHRTEGEADSPERLRAWAASGP
jgi:uncharacterized phage-associated protein